MSANATQFVVRDYDLAATLTSGQAFRWREIAGAWEGVVADRWVRLRQVPSGIAAETHELQRDWRWLAEYLQVGADYSGIVATFPHDPPMQSALEACRGLRLLRQDPWECLASFICSSTKQIVQIQQIVSLLSERFGKPLSPAGRGAFAFPSPERLARGTEAQLRECKMGFRAPNLLATARIVAAGRLNLESLHSMKCAAARDALAELPGVGPKIADCVLLFACGFQEAFPVDVWVRRSISELYFHGDDVPPAKLALFITTHFGPWAGYAQQYLFHFMRTKSRSASTHGENRLKRRGA